MRIPEEALLYVGDPMCSWCYGFMPVLEQIRSDYEKTVPVKAVMGGLRPGEAAEVLDHKMARFLKHHWEQVSSATGQPFDYSSLEIPEDSQAEDLKLYDTEPGARAVVTFREFRPEKEIDYFAALQTAYYAKAKDPTATETFTEALKGFDTDPDEFLKVFESDEIKYETSLDFQLARAVGATGFPSLVYLIHKTAYPVCRGYLPYKELKPLIENAIQAGQNSR